MYCPDVVYGYSSLSSASASRPHGSRQARSQRSRHSPAVTRVRELSVVRSDAASAAGARFSRAGGQAAARHRVQGKGLAGETSVSPGVHGRNRTLRKPRTCRG